MEPGIANLMVNALAILGALWIASGVVNLIVVGTSVDLEPIRKSRCLSVWSFLLAAFFLGPVPICSVLVDRIKRKGNR